MKNKIVLIVTIVVLAIGNASAKKLRANNTGVRSVPGFVFSTLDSAYKAASAGDSIYVEPSPVEYTVSPITKKIILIGNGYFLDENPGLSYNNVTSKIVNPNNSSAALDIQEGAGGSIFTGLDFIYRVYLDASNITLIRNRFRNNLYFDSSPESISRSNIILNRNYFDGTIDWYYSSGSFTKVLITNNILRCYINLPTTYTGILENNTIIGNNCAAATYLSVEVYNFIIQNNLILPSDNSNPAIVATNINNSFMNNVCAGAITEFPTGTGNKFNVDMTTVFVGTGSSDGKYKLKPSSPASGAGIGGTDCGAYGGSTPYLLSGQPNIPVIYYLAVPANSNGNTLNVTLSTKSNP